MPVTLKLPKVYKTLLMLAIVIGPFYWLTFTEDGRWRTDLALMGFLGRPDFNAALESFTSHLTESELRSTFAKLDWQCSAGANRFGNRHCAAMIGTFNQIPARSAHLFFQGGALSAVKVVYQTAYHAQVRRWIERRAKTVQQGALPSAIADQGVIVQPVAGGVLLLPESAPSKEDEPALIWMAHEAMETAGE
ncbi:hypothetical protein GWK36_06640 [Caldichromatium japonicum]|uniref:Uncharacterized protein n=1 Tax=Caldichromatium japonicum TaxID=2699430 RepID=A0A6G7VCA5_9GAMM|nr:hypothetical protein [Caldichromatium japonicum]QIK37713.1 hypothetical protein GWK36_06640 [Caldichromatium japonicum]